MRVDLGRDSRPIVNPSYPEHWFQSEFDRLLI